MKILPAIDLLDGKCVRLKQGDYRQVTIYSDNPIEVAKRFESLGATMLHVVDLNAARTDEATNRSIIEELAKTLGIPIQVGGGIRSLATAMELLDRGVKRIILGTAAVEDETLLRSLIQFDPKRICVAVDAQDGIVKTRGWKTSTVLSSADWIRHLESIGVQTIIYTDISKDGMLQGPNLELYRSLIETTSMNIIASGGISSIEDLIRLKAIGVDGAIVGTAYYEGTIDLKEALSC